MNTQNNPCDVCRSAIRHVTHSALETRGVLQSVIDSHLLQCQSCQAFQQRWHKEQAALSEAFLAVDLPKNLQVKSFSQVQSLKTGRWRKKRLLYTSALAASVAGVFFAGYASFRLFNPPSESVEFVSQTDPIRLRDAWENTLEYYFRPNFEFDYRHLKSAGDIQLPDGQVYKGLVLFRSDINATATVLVVPKQNFELKDWQNVSTRRVQYVQVINDTYAPDSVIYVVLVTGGTIQTFEKPSDF